MSDFEQTRYEHPGFERQLRSALHDVLDIEHGPHPAWSDSPASRRISLSANRRVTPGNLRLFALAAVLVVGGAAAAGAFLRQSPVPPLPVSPLPSQPLPSQPAPTEPLPTVSPLPTQTLPTLPLPTQPSPTPGQTAGPQTNGLIAYEQDDTIWVGGIGEEPTVISAGAGRVQSCPQFGLDGLLAFADRDPVDLEPRWEVDVVRLAPDGTRHDPVSTQQVDVRPDVDVACFEWSPDGEKIAYTVLIGSDVHFTIEDPRFSYNAITISRDRLPLIPDYVHWKPDGTAVAFVGHVSSDGNGTDMYSEIWLGFVDATAPKKVLQSDANEIISDLAWSPDGTAIAYRVTAFTRGGDQAESLVRVLTFGPGEDRTDFVLDRLDDPRLTIGAGPAWSVDGSQLAWVLGGELRVGAPDGSGWRALPPVSSDELGLGWATDPVIWSADGSQILVGQADAPSLGSGVQTSLVLYDVVGGGQPLGVLPWRPGGYGRITWQLLTE